MHFPPNPLGCYKTLAWKVHHTILCSGVCVHGLYAKSSALVTPKDQSAGTGVWHFDFGLTNHREFFRRWPAPSDLLFPRYRAGCISHHSSVGKAKFSQLFKLWKATLRARCCSTLTGLNKCRAWNCQWPLPQPQLAWAHRTPGTLMCRGNQLLQTKLRSDSLPKGVDLNPHHSREQRKPVSQPLAPAPTLQPLEPFWSWRQMKGHVWAGHSDVGRKQEGRAQDLPFLTWWKTKDVCSSPTAMEGLKPWSSVMHGVLRDPGHKKTRLFIIINVMAIRLDDS